MSDSRPSGEHGQRCHLGASRRGGPLFGNAGKRLLGLTLVLCLGQLGVGVRTVRSEEVEKFPYNPQGHRDPFVALVRDGRIVGVPTLRSTETLRPMLYGILWDPEGRSSIALINDKEVTVGDQVGTYRVEEIRPDAVVLAQDDGGTVVLQVSFDTPDATQPPSAPGAARTKGGKHP